MIKKMAAVAVLSATLLGNVVIPHGAVKADGATSVTEETSILNSMGISAVDSQGYIMRGDFTVLMVQAAGLSYEGKSADMFTDVEGAWSEYIGAAASVGYINGVNGGKFNPEKIISTEDALTIALRVLGYRSFENSEVRDGMVDVLELCESIPRTGNLKCSDASKLILNMLEAKCADYDGDEVVIGDESFMYKQHGVYRTKGVINGTRGISLADYPEIEDYEVCLDNVVCRNEADIDYEYLGCNVSVYVKEYDDYSSVIWYKGRGNKALRLESKDIGEVYGFNKNDNGQARVLYDENNRTKTENLENDAMVYLNRVNTVGVSNSTLMPKSGTLTLIDTDDNGRSDIVIVEKYDYYMVSAVDYAKQAIYSEDNKPDIELETFYERDVSILYDGKYATVDEIKSGILLSVMCSYNANGKIDTSKPLVVEILNSSVAGTVSVVGDNGTIVIDGTEYAYSDLINTDLHAGKNGVFYLGKFGEVVYWKQDASNDGLSYGYIMEVAPDNNMGITHVSLFDMSGTKHRFTIDDKQKVKYSGLLSKTYVSNRNVSRAEFYDLFSSKQLVKYSAENGRLIRIHKAVDGTAIDGYTGYDEERFTMDYKGSSERLYAQFLSENYKISTKTIMVGVSKEGISDDDFVVGGYDYFGTDVTGLNVQLYDSSETFVPSVVVVTFDDLEAASRKPNNNFVNTKFAALIVGSKTKINEYDENVTVHEAYCGGVLVEIEPVNDRLYDVKGTNWSGEQKKYFNELKPGDVIQYATDSKGKANIFHVIHDHSDKTSRYVMFNSNDYLSEMNTGFGKVTGFEAGSYFALDCSDTRKYPFGRYSPNVYVYYESRNKAERLTSLVNLSEEDYVFVRCARADVKDIIIYRR